MSAQDFLEYVPNGYKTQPSWGIAVLAGGNSKRMGQDKSLLSFGGKPMLTHVLEALRPLKLPVILIANQPEKYMGYGLPMYPDAIPNTGSLGGVYTAILESSTRHTLCVACDMPFLSFQLIYYLFSLSSGTYDAIVPVIDNHPEPLHAIYSKTCLTAIRSKIDTGKLKISGFYEELNVCYVDETTMKSIDPSLRSFLNINTPDEWHMFDKQE